MTRHHVKSWSHFFDAIKAGKKLHDLRKLDRDYKVGDILVLQRYDNINGEYTGEELEAEITYITSNKTPCAFSSSALAKEYGIFSLKKLSKNTIDITVSPDKYHLPLDSRIPVMIKKDVERFARGGQVKPNTSYLVGEREPVYTSKTEDGELHWEQVGQYRG